jgi:aromatic ring-opening dioxygenase catalytic subunit (LigB family)
LFLNNNKVKAARLNKITSSFKSTDKMPVLFLGHGSPMNAIVNNEFVLSFKAIGEEIPAPTAVLCISAHWETAGTWVTAMDMPATIHDFGGFPQALFDVHYAAPGSPNLAAEVKNIVGFDWAIEAIEQMKNYILTDNHQPLINFRNQGKAFDLAIPTPDHFLPLLYALALKEDNEAVSVFNDKPVAGSLMMTSVKIG